MQLDFFQKYPWMKPPPDILVSTGNILKTEKYALYLERVFQSVVFNQEPIPQNKEVKWKYIVATLVRVHRDSRRPGNFYLRTSVSGCNFAMGVVISFVEINKTQLELISKYLDTDEKKVVCQTDHPVLLEISGILSSLN